MSIYKLITLFYFRTNADEWNVRAGSSQHESGGVSYNVSSVVNHPEYSPATIDYDIAVLILSEAIAIDDLNTKIISLPTLNLVVPAGSDALVTGWGSTAVSYIIEPCKPRMSPGYICVT